MASQRAAESNRATAVPAFPPRPRSDPWLPLYLLLVAAATLFPFWLHCQPASPSLALPGPRDLLQNIVLFVPLGVAMRHSGRLWCLLGALLLSLTLECLQPFVLRCPSLWDVIFNGAGALLGHRLGPAFERHLRRDLSPLALLIAVALLAVCAVSSRLQLGDGFEDWQPMPLVIGNEPSLDRPWRGRLAEFAIYDRADPDRDRWGPAGPPAWRRGGPVLWVRFQAPASARMDGPAGPTVFDPLAAATPVDTRVETAGLVLEGGVWQLPASVSTHVFEHLVARNRLSVYLHFEPSSLRSIEPGRILSLSTDSGVRDFSVAQDDAEVVFRVRSPVTDENATHPDTTTTNSPLSLAEHRVWARYDGHHTRIDVDGRCAGERLLAARRGWGPLAEPLGATLVAGSGFAAWGVSGTARGMRRRRRIALGSLAGASFGLALWALGAWQLLPHLGPWAVALTAAASGFGVRAGLAWSASSVSQDGPVR